MITEAEVGAAMANQMRESNRLLEASLDLLGKYVSFDDELFDGTGREVWSKIGFQDFSHGAAAIACQTEGEFDEIRNHCRWLALENEFAINGHENRINYIVGAGHVYHVAPKPDENVDPAMIDTISTIIRDFIRVNQWHRRQQEIVRRRDRDGEAFLRFFPSADGLLRVRFIEPERVRNRPDEQVAKMGIISEPEDAETAVSYVVYRSADDYPELVDAEHIQHRKANVDCTTPRGLPLFYPVRKNLARAEKLLNNMGHLAGMRAAIAMVRKHVRGAKATITDYVSNMADAKVTNAHSGDTVNYRKYRPGTVLDHPDTVEYDFPSHDTDIASFVSALQAELRAIASRLVMPEFMLSSDASNANYASTMVAEGPAVKMFEREQADMIQYDLEVLRLAINTAARAGKVAEDVLARVEITAEPPNVRTRNQLQDAQADQVLSLAGVLSKQTYAARHGLDWEAERANMEDEAERDDGLGGGLDLGGGAGEEE